MEPITTSIVTALVAGAVAGLKPTVSQVIKDGYEGLKALIKRKYSQVSIDQLEAEPTSTARRAVVEEDLQKTNAEKDPEVLAAGEGSPRGDPEPAAGSRECYWRGSRRYQRGLTYDSQCHGDRNRGASQAGRDEW